MYTTYILYSKTIKQFYTGQTEDLERRIMEHNRGKTPFMKRGIPWELVYHKAYETRAEAMQDEKRIKKRGAGRFLEEHGVEVG